MPSVYLLTGSLICFLWVVQQIVKRYNRRSLDYLHGPPSRSWLVGNFPDLFRPNEIGDADFAWIKEYGKTFRINLPFGKERLYTADPKAIHYILNTAGYNFPKASENRAGGEMVFGRGIVLAEGPQHARQRKIMNPAFSFAALRHFLPLFRRTTQRAVNKIKDDVLGIEQTKVTDIMRWLSLLTLDAIGEAAFGYQFDAISQAGETELAKAYQNLFIDAFADRSDFSLAMAYAFGYMPSWLVRLIFHLPIKPFRRLHDYMKTARRVAQDIVDKQTDLYKDGKEGSRDVMSILVRANLSEDPKTRLTTEEILPQMTTLFLAGHSTTGLSSSWALYQLSRNLEYQTLIREEIKATRAAAAERGDIELTIADLDSMKYLLAAMKETLRFNPVISGFAREAGRDDVIPLSIPQKTKTGETITSVPVSKGQTVLMSCIGYNRLPEIWGPDADQWRPQRFLEGVQASQEISLGVFSNIATFSSGLRSCIGWRFAILEMQAILIEMLENFEFTPPGDIEIIRGPAGLMSPMVKGAKVRKAELPITITTL